MSYEEELLCQEIIQSSRLLVSERIDEINKHLFAVNSSEINIVPQYVSALSDFAANIPVNDNSPKGVLKNIILVGFSSPLEHWLSDPNFTQNVNTQMVLDEMDSRIPYFTSLKNKFSELTVKLIIDGNIKTDAQKKFKNGMKKVNDKLTKKISLDSIPDFFEKTKFYTFDEEFPFGGVSSPCGKMIFIRNFDEFKQRRKAMEHESSHSYLRVFPPNLLVRSISSFEFDCKISEKYATFGDFYQNMRMVKPH